MCPSARRDGLWWSTPDALGPKVLEHLQATRHLELEYGTDFCRKHGYPVLSGITPGVMAQTGMETAEIVLRGREIPIITDVRLEEMGFGICEGTTDFQDNPDNPIYPLFAAPETYRIPVEGGESLEDLYARTGAFLKEVIEPQLRQGKDILIVGHGAMNASIVCQIKDIPVKDFWSVKMKNAELVRLL